jgi:hypothetical protein
MVMRQLRWSTRSERARYTAMLWCLPFALLGCSATGAFDAGDAGADVRDSGADADAGSDAGDSGTDAGETALSCEEQFRAAVEGFRTSQTACLSREPEVTGNVTFRVRNVGAEDFWVPRYEVYGAFCTSSVTVTTCAGAVVKQSPLAQASAPSICGHPELCPDEQLRVAPDASVELSWSPYVQLAIGCGCQATTSLPAGSYSARFAYTRDRGVSTLFLYPSTAEFPFVLSADGGVIDIAVP